MSPRRRSFRSADSLGLTLAVNGSARQKAATRVVRLRTEAPGGFLWKETEAEFKMYRGLFPVQEDICVVCLKDGKRQVAKGGMQDLDGWGNRGWVKECPTHGKDPKVKPDWQIGKAEKTVVRSIAYVMVTARAGKKGKVPKRDGTWNLMERHMAKVFDFVKNRGVA